MIESYYSEDTLVYKKDDIPKPLELLLKDELTQQPIDFLSGATAVFGLWAVDRATGIAQSLFTPRAATVNVAEGTLTHNWALGDLNAAGKFYGCFIVTFADSTVMSFPQKGYLEIEIESLE